MLVTKTEKGKSIKSPIGFTKAVAPANSTLYEQFIPKSDYDTVVKKLVSLRKRFIKKIGKDSFSFSIDTDTSYLYKKTYDGITSHIECYNVIVIVTTPEVKYNGYEYIATIKVGAQLPNGKVINFVHATDGAEGHDLSKYQHNPLTCDHCNTNRRRNQTHIFTTPNGDTISVANKCSEEYFGVEVYNKLQSILWGQLNSQDIFKGLGGFEDLFDIAEFTALAYGSIKIRGYHKTYDDDSTVSELNNLTKEHIEHLKQYGEGDSWKEQQKIADKYFAIAERDGFTYDSLCDYWLNVDATNDFLGNCVSAVFSKKPLLGLLAYSVWHIEKEKIAIATKKLEEETRKANNFVNEFIGSVGDKLTDIKAVVSRTNYIRGFYGDSVLVSLIDSIGRTIVFFDKQCREYAVGDTLIIKGKVKQHKEYKGVKQTTLYYVKFTK